MGLYTPLPVPLGVSVNIPQDGETPMGAIFGGPHEVGLDGIRALQNLVAPGTSALGAQTITRSIGFGSVLRLDTARGIFDTFGANGSGVGNVSNIPSAVGDAFTLVCDITASLPHGATLIHLAALVAGGTTSAGGPAGPARIRLWSTSISTGTAGNPDTMHKEEFDAASSKALWEAKHLAECNVVPSLVIDRVARRYWVELRGDYGANITQSARYLGFRATWSYAAVDPGAG